MKDNLQKLFDYHYRTMGRQLPGYLSLLAEQEEKHLGGLSDEIQKKINIYQVEKNLEGELSARSDRMAIRQKLADYIENEVAGAFPYFGYQEWAEKLRGARQKGALGVVVSTEQNIVAWDQKVNCVRLCPDDAREETQRITKRYAPEIARMLERDKSLRVYFQVFTMPNKERGQLKEGMREIYKRFSNFHRSTYAKNRIQGSFAMIEAPLSAQGDWNIHLNVISVVKGSYDYGKVRSWWGWNVHIQQMAGSVEEIYKGFLEAVKYAAKHVGEKSEDGKHLIAPPLVAWPPGAFHEWFQAGKGFRRSRTYGCLYRTPEPMDRIGDDVIEWVGSIQYESNAYSVRFKRVDSILADNFATGGSEASAAPDPRGLPDQYPPPNY